MRNRSRPRPWWFGPLMYMLVTTIITAPLWVSAWRSEGAPASSTAATEVYTGPVVVRGCAIRFDVRSVNTGRTIPRIYVNSAHKCSGAKSISVEADGDLLVRAPDSRAVVTMTVTSDETMTAMGLRCGPSGGGATTTIRCYDLDGARVRADQIYAQLANLWLGWVNVGDQPAG